MDGYEDEAMISSQTNDENGFSVSLITVYYGQSLVKSVTKEHFLQRDFPTG